MTYEEHMHNISTTYRAHIDNIFSLEIEIEIELEIELEIAVAVGESSRMLLLSDGGQMDREETRRILQHIEQVYPARFRGLGKAAAERMLELWEGVFRDVPMDVMQEAVHRFIRRNTKGYAPEAGELMVVVNEVSPVKYAEVVKPESNWMKVSPMGAEAIRRLIAEEGGIYAE